MITRNITCTLLVATLGLFGLAGCNDPDICTTKGCSTTVSLRIIDAPEGDWEVYITKDTIEGNCAVTLPATSFNCPGYELYAQLDGADLVFTLMAPMGEEPGPVSFTVTFDEVVFADDTVTPDFEGPWYPNGEDCDEVGCYNAEIDVEVP